MGRRSVRVGVACQDPRPATEGVKPECVNGVYMLTASALERQWGPNVMEFHRRARTAVQTMERVIFKSKDGQAGKSVPVDDLLGWATCFVDYRAGQGKYQADTQVVFSHTLPTEVSATGQFWPVVVFAVAPDKVKQYRAAGLTDMSYFTCVRQLQDRRQVTAWPIDLRRQEDRAPLTLRLRGGPPPPPALPPANPLDDQGVWEVPPPWVGDAQQPGAIAAAAEEVD